MTTSTLPNIGITAGFIPGEDAWSTPMNRNLRLLDALVQLRVVDKDLATPPATPTAGTVYIVAASPTGSWAGHAGHLAIWQVGDDLGEAWAFVTPSNGWKCYVIDEAVDYKYSGGTWSVIESGGGGGGGGVSPVFTETGTLLQAGLGGLDDAGRYTRFTHADAKLYQFNALETYPANAEYHGRNVGAADLTLQGTNGFTLNAPADGSLVVPQNGNFTVKIVAEGEADVYGVTKPYVPVDDDSVIWQESRMGVGMELSTDKKTVSVIENAEHRSVTGVMGRQSNKRYFEVLIASQDPAVRNICVGITEYGQDLDNYIGADAYSWSLQTNGSINNDGTATPYGSAIAQGDIIGVAVDFTTGAVFFSVNGVWLGTSDPVTGTDPAYTTFGSYMYPAVSLYNGTEAVKDSVTGLFGDSELNYPNPEGYTTWAFGPPDIG